jgi:DNA-binding IclR family transcriptional regulator
VNAGDMIVKSAQRVVDIFEAVASSPEGLGISDLARRLSIPKSSAWNLVQTLLERRYLEQVPAGRFVLGSRLFDVGVCARADTRLQSMARPLMEALVERTGETAFLGILTPNFEVLQLDKVVSPHVIRYDADLGQPRPAHCTAIGKALLAHLPAAQLAYYLRTKKRERFTKRTITDRKALLAELAEVRRSGIAVNIEERVPGASAIGAPIYAPSGRAIAGIIVAGPTARIVARRPEISRLVKETAEQISAALRNGLAAAEVARGEERWGPATGKAAVQRQGDNRRRP